MCERKPNTWIICSVAYASIIESLALLPWCWWLRTAIDSNITYRSDDSSPGSDDLVAAKDVLTYTIAAYALRVVVGLILFKKSYETAIIFIICNKFGIIINLIAGMHCIKYSWTYVIGIVTLSTTVLHIIYIILIYIQTKALKNVSWEDNHCDSGRPECEPHGTANRPSVFIISTENGYCITRVPPPPYTANDTNIPIVSEPPSYESVFGDEQEGTSRSESTE